MSGKGQSVGKDTKEKSDSWKASGIQVPGKPGNQP